MAENFNIEEQEEKMAEEEKIAAEAEETEEAAVTGEAEGDSAEAEEEAADEVAETADETTEDAPDEENKESEDAGEKDAEPKEEKENNSSKAGAGEKKGFFKKKKDKKDELIEELNDRVKRQMAEFENFRKRSDKEKSQMYGMGAKGILEKILPVVDNFERGLAGLDEETEDPFADGMKMVYKQMMTALEEAGVKPIEAVGAEFDPEYHNAVMHIDDEAYGENEIVEELQKGYLYHGSVVRFSMVKVAN